MIENSTVNFACPLCGAAMSVKLKQIGSAVDCPHCGKSIMLENEDNAVERFDADVKKSVKNLFKDLK